MEHADEKGLRMSDCREPEDNFGPGGASMQRDDQVALLTRRPKPEDFLYKATHKMPHGHRRLPP